MEREKESQDDFQSRLTRTEAQVERLKFQVKIFKQVFLFGLLYFAVRFILQTTNQREHLNPRSNCLIYDADRFCTLWTNLDSRGLENGQSADLAHFAADCVKRGYTTEFKAIDPNGGVIFACVKNGCEAKLAIDQI